MKKTILTIAVLVLFLSGCEYFVLPAAEDTICEPPSQLIRDVNGDLVCVDVEEEETSIEEKVEQVIEEQSETVEEEPVVEVEMSETPTGAVVIETSEEIITGETEATVVELPRKTVTEGEFVSFPNLRATDPDGDTIQYTFSAPLNEFGQWQTRVGDAGEYKVSIIASDGKQQTNQDIILFVESKNKAPIVRVKKSVFVNEGETVKINPTASDPDSDRTTITISGWMNSKEKATDFSSAGTYTVKVTASDGQRSTTENVIVVVNNVNRPPVIRSVTGLDVVAGQSLSLAVVSEDPDNDVLSMSFSSPVKNDGTWETSTDDLGEYRITVSVSDGSDTVTKDVTVSVRSPNNPPILEISDVLSYNEGDLVVLDVVTSDPEGDDIALTYSGWMVTDRFQTDFQDSGSHPVVITATDGFNTVTKEITINVADVNRPPNFDPGAFN